MILSKIEVGNSAIADFMGIKTGDRDYPYVVHKDSWRLGGLRYHRSWDWLIPVIEKIQSLGYSVHLESRFGLAYHRCVIFKSPILIDQFGEAEWIDSAWKAVVEFINKFNDNINQAK